MRPTTTWASTMLVTKPITRASQIDQSTTGRPFGPPPTPEPSGRGGSDAGGEGNGRSGTPGGSGNTGSPQRPGPPRRRLRAAPRRPIPGACPRDLVAAVDVVHIVDLGLAVGAERRDHEGHPGPDVERPDRRGGQLRHAADHRVVALGTDVGAHPPQFPDVQEPAFEHVLGHDARAVGDGEHREQDRLEIGGDARVRQRDQVHRLLTRVLAHAETVAVRLDRRPGVGELRQQELEMLGPSVVDRDVAERRDGRRRPVPTSIRSGTAVCSAPCSSSTPWISIVLEPAPSICAPIVVRNSARSAISGSRAALSITEVPRASTDASKRFSVAVTLG